MVKVIRLTKLYGTLTSVQQGFIFINTFSVGAPAKNLLPVAGLVAYAREPLVFNLFFQLLLT